MTTRMLFTALLLLPAVSLAETQSPHTTHYVTANTLNVRYAPTTDSKKAGVLFRNQPVSLIANNNSHWHKIHHPETNLTGWVAAAYLSSAPLSAQAHKFADRDLIRAIIKHSDDFKLHEALFLQTTIDLLETKRCSFSDISAMHGWWRSLEHKDQLIYYTYCGSAEKRQAFYIDTRIGDLIPYKPLR